MTSNVLRLRIGQRLVLAFGLLLVFSLLIAALAVNRLNELSCAFTRVVDEQNETHEILNDIGASVKQRLGRYRQHYGNTVDLIEAERRDDALAMLGAQTEEALTLLMEAIGKLGRLEQSASIQQAVCVGRHGAVPRA